jgi:predicted MFS family arabinose efflux permease
MNDEQLEQMLVESLRIAKENREYLIKIDRRQRWARNWTAFYWAFIVVLALTGYYFAFPYLQVVREQFTAFSGQVGSLVNFTQVSK